MPNAGAHNGLFSGLKGRILMFFIFIFLFLIIPIGFILADLDCSVTSTPCVKPILKISGLSNAHAELPNQSHYGYYVCCSGISGLDNSCSGNFEIVLRLSGKTNAHVEEDGYTPRSYHNNVCLSAPIGKPIKCKYEQNNCPEGYVCLASISAPTNAHIGNCSAYSIKICCSSPSFFCDVNVPETAVVDQWIDIDVSGSMGPITQVRFSTDNNLNGSPDGAWTDWYDWNSSLGDWDAVNKKMKWRFAEPGDYEVWAEVRDNKGNTDSDYDEITILECYPKDVTTCVSPQGCIHTIVCRVNGTWPPCPSDECSNDLDCSLCPADMCVGPDWYDYPYYGLSERAHGNCINCQCDIGTGAGESCQPFIEEGSPNCTGITENCLNGIDDDGDGLIDCQDPDCPPTTTCSICFHLECSNSTYRWMCQPDPVGTDCGECKECDGSGNCIYTCSGDGDETSCECIADSCIDCSDYYDGHCGYQGVCHCGPNEVPVWDCSEGNCYCICQYDPSCGESPRPYHEVVIFPPSQEGNPGDGLVYKVTVINLGNKEETYTLIPSVPAGWSYSIGTTTVTVPAGESSPPINFLVISSMRASSGVYDISVGARNETLVTGYAKYIIPNQPPEPPTPSTEFSGGVDWNHCSYKGISVPTFYWNYSDPEGDEQESYQIQIDDNNPSTPVFNDVRDSSSPSYTPPVAQWKGWMKWNTNYWWRVRVKDKNGNWSQWSSSTLFTTPVHAGPWPEFVPSSDHVSLKEIVSFTDQSKCYTSDSPGGGGGSCSGASYAWDFDYQGMILGRSAVDPEFDTDDTTNGDNSTSYDKAGSYNIKLRIEDDFTTCISEIKTVIVTLPLPRWKEIAPF